MRTIILLLFMLILSTQLCCQTVDSVYHSNKIIIIPDMEKDVRDTIDYTSQIIFLKGTKVDIRTENERFVVNVEFPTDKIISDSVLLNSYYGTVNDEPVVIGIRFKKNVVDAVGLTKGDKAMVVFLINKENLNLELWKK